MSTQLFQCVCVGEDEIGRCVHRQNKGTLGSGLCKMSVFQSLRLPNCHLQLYGPYSWYPERSGVERSGVGRSTVSRIIKRVFLVALQRLAATIISINTGAQVLSTKQ